MSFTFNNQDFDRLGLYVEKYPDRQIPAKKFNVYDVPGQSGRIYVPQGANAFENVTQNYEVFVKDTSALQDILSKIAYFLLTPNEPVELRDSYDASVYRLAMFIGGGDWANSLNKYGKATLSFDCGPQRYDYPPTTSIDTLPSGANGTASIGTGLPRGNGYIDDPTPLIKISSPSGWSSTDELVVIIENMVTSETTQLKLEGKSSFTNIDILIDTARGTIWCENNVGARTVYDVDTYFDMTLVSGDPKMRFTYEVEITIYNNTTHSVKYQIDPRWYRL